MKIIKEISFKMESESPKGEVLLPVTLTAASIASRKKKGKNYFEK